MNKLLSSLVLFLLASSCFGQFEQKVTFNVSAGYVKPMGAQDYSKLVQGYDAKSPYIFGNFSAGSFINGGVQFNLNRNFSIGAKLRPLYLSKWNYTDQYGYDWSSNISMSLFNLGLGINSKYKILAGKKVNPFVIVELTGNYTSIDFKYQYNGDIIEGTPMDRKAFLTKSFGLGFNSALGLDINLTKNLGLFLQGGYSKVFINDRNFNSIYYDGNLEKENFTTVYLEVGVILSFLKSKEL